jgi:hypothetical protein
VLDRPISVNRASKDRAASIRSLRARISPRRDRGRGLESVNLRSVVTVDDVRALAEKLPRTTEALVRDRVKFRVGSIVYLALSRDESVMGFAFPKEEREALVASEPDKFMMPRASDLRYNWVQVRLASLDAAEMRELILDAWRMVVPKRVVAMYEEDEAATREGRAKS